MKILLVFLTFTSAIFPVLYLLMQNKGGNIPPGPLGLPIIGYLPFISSEPHKQFQNLAKYYGPIFRCRNIKFNTKNVIQKWNNVSFTKWARDVLELDDSSILIIISKIYFTVIRNAFSSVPLPNRYAVIIDDLPIIQNILARRKDRFKKQRRVTSINARALFKMEWIVHRIELEWLLEEMATLPDVQQQVVAEITTNVGYYRIPVAADLTEMPYVRSVVLELFRWKTFSPLRCIRIPNTDILLDGYFIPKDSLLLANVWSVNHNPKYFGAEVDSFKPERFLSNDGKRTIRENTFIPFCLGRRCISWDENALDNITLIFIRFIQRFNTSLLTYTKKLLNSKDKLFMYKKENSFFLNL